MKKIFPGMLMTFSVLAFLSLVSCDLLYPPAFYNKIVNQGSNNTNSGPSGPKSWQVVGSQYAITNYTTVAPILRINSSGVPCVLDVAASNATFWSYNSGSWNAIVVTNLANPISNAGMILNNGVTPFIIISETSTSKGFIFSNITNPFTAPALTYQVRYPSHPRMVSLLSPVPILRVYI